MKTVKQKILYIIQFQNKYCILETSYIHANRSKSRHCFATFFINAFAASSEPGTIPSSTLKASSHTKNAQPLYIVHF